MADLLTNDILTLVGSINECRLTLETGVAVSTTDQTAKTTVYLTPYVGNRISLFDGVVWKLYSVATDKSLALGTLTSGANYDIFGYDSSGTVTLEFSAAWASATARTDALAFQDGVLVKSGATTRRYLGTMRTTSTTTTEDSGGGGTTQVGGKRFLWNHANRVSRPLAVVDLTDTWTYTTASYRQANGAAGNKVEVVVGVAGVMLDAASKSIATYDASGTAMSGVVAAGIGIDSTTVNAAQLVGSFYMNSGTIANVGDCMAFYRGLLGLGYHAINWLESGSTHVSFIGDNGVGVGAASSQAGLIADLRA